MDNAPIVAVLGIGGQQNGAIASAFANKGLRVRGIGRASAPPAGRIFLHDYRAVDPADHAGLAAALSGADVAVFTSPIDHRPGVRERLVDGFLAAASRAGVGRVVFNPAASIFEDRTHPVAKVLGALSDAVLAGPVPANVVEPTVYMDNLMAPWAVGGIVNDGVLAYPMPPEARVSYISHASLGAFVHAAAVTPIVGRRFKIGGPEALTGAQLAEVLSATLGRPVVYRRIPPAALAEGLNAAFGAPAGDDIAALYTTMETQPDVMRRDPSGWKELGVAPEPFAVWARRQAWPSPS